MIKILDDSLTSEAGESDSDSKSNVIRCLESFTLARVHNNLSVTFISKFADEGS